MTTDLQQTAADEVLVEFAEHVLTVTINRPRARNAINENVCRLVGAALERAEKDREVRVVVLTAAGDLAFSAGADLKALAAGVPIVPEGEPWQRWGLAGVVGHYISKPIIAAVNGAALGGGAEIALACDLIVAARSASFGLPEVRRGLVAGAGGAFRLVDQVPRRVAMQMLLTGEAIDANRALELDLINMVVPDDEVRSAAAELARTIASNAPLAVQAAKRIARGQDGDACPDEREHWARTGREVEILMASADAAEGPRAFAEKRPPVWSGR